MRRFNSDTVIAVLLLLACGVLYHATYSFREIPLAIVTSDVWPRVVIVALSVFSAIYLFQSVRAGAADKGGRRVGLKGWILANRNVFWCYGLFALFLLTLPYLGMLLGGALFVFAVLTAMGRRDIGSHLINALIAVVSVGAMWAVFTFGLRVMLPEGEILSVF
jgi:putative tricarboxylic transport membrane protein